MMFSSRHWRTCLSIAALAAALPGMGLAQTPAPQTQAEMEARLQRLEAAIATLTQQLEAERIRNAQPAQVAAPQLEQRVQQLETRASAAQPEGFAIANGRIRFGGFVKADGVFTQFNDGRSPDMTGGGNNVREFYVPGATPVGGVGQDAMFTGHAKQTRLTMTVSPDTPGHRTSAYLEMDFQSVPGTQGSQTVTNAYTLGLRRAYVTYDNWMIGQDWTTFQNTAVLPETTDFIGSTDGTVFARQPQVRYTRAAGDHVQFQFAAENPDVLLVNSGSSTTRSPDDDFIPDLVGRVNFTYPQGTFTLAGIVRNLSVSDQIGTVVSDDSQLGWGISASGKIPFGTGNVHDLRFMVTGGEGIGRYLALGFVPDAYLVASGTSLRLEPISVVSGGVALRLKVSDMARTNFGVNYIAADHDRRFAAAALNDESWSAFANIFFTPVRGMDVGVEYRRANRETFNGLDGSLDRVHLVVRRSF